MTDNPFLFIVGCPRSGTTLLQRMFDHHPDLAMGNDSHFIPKAIEAVCPDALTNLDRAWNLPLTPQLVEWVRSYYRFARLGLPSDAVNEAATRSRTYPEFVSAVFDAVAKLHGKRVAGEKTPGYVRYLPLLHMLFPWVRSIHIIRDGRDVALSTLEWATPEKGPGRFALWKKEPVATCALWWRWKVGTGWLDGRRLGPSRYREVRYETLVQQPEPVMRELCDFARLPFAPEMLAYHVGKVRHKPSLSAKSAWLPPTAGLRDWRSQMGLRDVELIEALAGSLLTRLGYERRFDTISHGTALLAESCERCWNQELALHQGEPDRVPPIAPAVSAKPDGSAVRQE